MKSQIYINQIKQLFRAFMKSSGVSLSDTKQLNSHLLKHKEENILQKISIDLNCKESMEIPFKPLLSKNTKAFTAKRTQSFSTAQGEATEPRRHSIYSLVQDNKESNSNSSICQE